MTNNYGKMFNILDIREMHIKSKITFTLTQVEFITENFTNDGDNMEKWNCYTLME